MVKRRVLAISPTLECVYLAGQCRNAWDELQIAGRNLISERLEEWRRDPAIREVIIMVYDIADPHAVREGLKRLGARPVRVRWFARSRSAFVTAACQGLGHVELSQAEDLMEAVGRVFPKKAESPGLDCADLRDYLRYKITLSFMRSLDPTPLVEAATLLSKHTSTPFELRRAVPADAESVVHMREADFPYIVGQSATIAELKSKILRVAPTDMSALIVGPTGTGKEAVAFYLHEFSRRRSKPFVSINCAGLQEEFLRSELFGHVKGAFTGAIADRQGLVKRAHGGTLFLDELGDMPVAIQADLLRFLQTRTYRRMGDDSEQKADIRVIAAAQEDVWDKMEKKELRKDLFYRVAEVELRTPALADVGDDIIHIIRHIAYRLRDDLHIERGPVEETLAYFEKGLDTLRKYPWPGNVRELSRCVKQRLLVGHDVIMELESRIAASPHVAGWAPETRGTIDPGSIRRLEDVTRDYVQRVWEGRGNLTQAGIARHLGIAINTLKKLVRKSGERPSKRT